MEPGEPVRRLLALRRRLLVPWPLRWPAHRPLGTARGDRARRRPPRARARAVRWRPGTRAALRDLPPGGRRHELGVRAVQRDRGTVVRDPPRARRGARTERRERGDVRRPAARRATARAGRLAARVRRPGCRARPRARPPVRSLHQGPERPWARAVRGRQVTGVGRDDGTRVADAADRPPPILRAPGRRLHDDVDPGVHAARAPGAAGSRPGPVLRSWVRRRSPRSAWGRSSGASGWARRRTRSVAGRP